jgi:hypothetical protein
LSCIESIAQMTGALVKEEYGWPGVLALCPMKGELDEGMCL